MATGVRRIALLGATGSIGRQSLEIVDCASRPRGLRPRVRLASAGGPRGRARRRAHTGRRRPHRAPGGIAARPRPERGRRVRGRRRDALGARPWSDARAREQGEPRRRRGPRADGLEAGRRAAPARRQRALRAPPVPRGPTAGDGRLARPHGLRRPVPKPAARRSRISDRGGCARPSDLVDGPEDHDRLGDAREQGPRADRGAVPVRRAVRADRRRRAPELDRSRPRPLPRRRSARSCRLPGHARADLVRAHVSGAARDARLAARPVRAAHARVRAARPRALPAAAARARSGGEGRHLSLCVQRGQRGRRRRVPRPAHRLPRDRTARGGRARRGSTGAPARDLDELVEADGQARRLAERKMARA